MISRPLSIYLDVWRVLAALVVFIYHSGNTKGFGDAHLPRSMGFDDGRAAHLAVVVFFVLSGYLISYSASKPGLTMRKYFVDRIARMYSVVLPALALTAVVMACISRYDPQLYTEYTVNGLQVVRYAINALFLQQAWFFCVVPGMLAPIWSLGYEFWYYVLFGFWTFVKQPFLKWPILALTAVIIGPKVLLLFGAWLAGVLAHRYSSENQSITLKKYVFWITLLLTVASLMFAKDLPFWSDKLGQEPLYYSANWLVDLLFSPIAALNLWSAGGAFPKVLNESIVPPWLSKTIKYFAGISFSLYLYHVPLFFFCSVVFGPSSEIWTEMTRMLSVLVVTAVLARFTEGKLLFFRGITEKLFDFGALFLRPIFTKINLVRYDRYSRNK